MERQGSGTIGGKRRRRYSSRKSKCIFTLVRQSMGEHVGLSQVPLLGLSKIQREIGDKIEKEIGDTVRS